MTETNKSGSDVSASDSKKKKVLFFQCDQSVKSWMTFTHLL